MAIGAAIGAIVSQVAGSIAEGQVRYRWTNEDWFRFQTTGDPFGTPSPDRLLVRNPRALQEEGLVRFFGLDNGNLKSIVADVGSVGRPASVPMISVTPAVIGRPAIGPQIPLPPIAGSTELTATVGAPTMTPRVIVAQTPPNQNTPRDGFPGGSFNYNALLQSMFKWDLLSVVSVANPGVGATVSQLVLPFAGPWAWEIDFSADTLQNVNIDTTDNAVESAYGQYWLAAGMSQRQSGILLITRGATTSGSGMVSGIEVVSNLATAGNFSVTIRAKQLASL